MADEPTKAQDDAAAIVADDMNQEAIGGYTPPPDHPEASLPRAVRGVTGGPGAFQRAQVGFSEQHTDQALAERGAQGRQQEADFAKMIAGDPEPPKKGFSLFRKKSR